MNEPLETDVLVIGGGLAGTATACFLAREGTDVLVVDQTDFNTRASGCNAGSLHAQIPHETFLTDGEEWARTFAPAITLMLRSIELWQTLSDSLETDLEVSVRGGLLLAETEGQMRQIRCKAEIERGAGLEIDILGQAELRSVAPYVSDRMIGAAFCPTEGKANPLKATPAFAQAAYRAGARLQPHCTVQAIERTRRGFAVATTSGPIRAGRVVNAAGIDAGRVAALSGLDLPVFGMPLQVSVTEPVATLVPHLVYSAVEKLTLKQSAAGSLLIGGGWPSRHDPETGALSARIDSLVANLAVAERAVPAVAGARVVRTWPAMVNGTASWRPLLGEVPGVPGLFINVFPWMGFTASPFCARIVADLVLSREPPVDVRPFVPGAMPVAA